MPLVSLRRRLQSRILRAVRSSRFFPVAWIDRLGDDDALAGTSLDATVLVYFPDALDSLYQVTPWLPAFEELHATLPVAIATQDSRVSSRLRELTDIPVATIARYGTLDDLLGRSEVKLALYVSHAPRNFEALRFTSLMHVYLGHGDSDKGVSASNQLKAYDYAFLPGEAAVERVRLRLAKYDVAEHTKIVGQPQNAPLTLVPNLDARVRVLYAPTWEGAQPSVAYSSVLSHGRGLVDALLADGRFRVDVRPHPLSGVTSGEYAVATRAITDAVAAAGSGNRVIRADDETLEQSFARADVLITDVSAVASAWLPTLRPLIVTTPAGEQAAEADGGLLAAIPRLTATDAERAPEIVAEVIAADDPSARAELVRSYLSAFTPDQSRARFVEACVEVAAERDAERARLRALGGGAL
ncbi:CDP-glycerol glycerophosphotransferase family protein [Galbitalea sp. SE-J8]|uniref:CDP-glycerol glycerophosphotransferase family protein n=1 Tax=Galbitalea sp. SE-J8 TaxID=3054952 RepID=UPI00259C6A74|nr:CDP-glycerol glycerophosphotransferase family protein [Galbitalea sp. SE-J8]MDM4763103.1 CDP-glycerol glycerophosphotransferase family protein [Galbitalea sp. SE-J8]